MTGKTSHLSKQSPQAARPTPYHWLRQIHLTQDRSCVPSVRNRCSGNQGVLYGFKSTLNHAGVRLLQNSLAQIQTIQGREERVWLNAFIHVGSKFQARRSRVQTSTKQHHNTGALTVPWATSSIQKTDGIAGRWQWYQVWDVSELTHSLTERTCTSTHKHARRCRGDLHSLAVKAWVPAYSRSPVHSADSRPCRRTRLKLAVRPGPHSQQRIWTHPYPSRSLTDEDDGRALGARLREQVAHARRPYAHKHLHEVRPGD